MAVALRGNLSDFGIGEVFQLIGQQRKTGVLEVDGGGERIHVSFVEGSVVSAATAGPHEDAALGDMLVRSGLLAPDRLVALEGRVEAEDFRRLVIHEEGLHARDVETMAELVTRETIFTLLRWTSGSFHFSAHPVRTRPDMRRWPAEQILMDGLRMVDEWRTFDADATREDAVFRQAGSFDGYREAVRGESRGQLGDAERLYQLLDGRLPARRAIDRSRVGSFEGARLLTALRRAGAIEPVSPSELPRAPRASAGTAPVRPGWRGAVAAALPFLALACVAAFAQRSPAPQGAALLADPLVAAQAAGAALRMRNAAEAFRFLHGRWPRDLAELAADGWTPDPAMAGDLGSPYSVPDRGAGGALLAPEHGRGPGSDS
jgi:hypothetical protein